MHQHQPNTSVTISGDILCRQRCMVSVERHFPAAIPFGCCCLSQESKGSRSQSMLCNTQDSVLAQYTAGHDGNPQFLLFLFQVIDLGSAEFVCQGQEVPHAFGTVRYSSPEMAAHSAGPASDVWSAGIVLCQVLTGRVPFLKDRDSDTLNYIRKGPEVS